MGTREKMIQWRQDMGVTLRKLSDRSGISESLLSMVEAGHVTHPKIVKKIQRLYGLTDEEAEELLPEIHRPSSPNYDPNKYKLPDRPFTAGAIPLKRSLVETYIREHQDQMAREHQKRSVY